MPLTGFVLLTFRSIGRRPEAIAGKNPKKSAVYFRFNLNVWVIKGLILLKSHFTSGNFSKRSNYRLVVFMNNDRLSSTHQLLGALRNQMNKGKSVAHFIQTIFDRNSCHTPLLLAKRLKLLPFQKIFNDFFELGIRGSEIAIGELDIEFVGPLQFALGVCHPDL